MDGPVDSPDGTGGDRTPPVELLTASVADLAYGVESGRVLRVTAFEGATPVPGSAPEVDGVTDVDGRVTVIVDAAALLEGSGREPVETDELIVLDRGDRRPVGLRTPHGVAVETVPAARIGPPTDSEGETGDASSNAADGSPRPDRPAPGLLRAVVRGDGADPRYLLDVSGVAAAVES